MTEAAFSFHVTVHKLFKRNPELILV